MKWNKCFVVQYGNIQYTNIVVKMEKSNFCSLKVPTVGGTNCVCVLQAKFWGRDASPISPIIAAHEVGPFYQKTRFNPKNQKSNPNKTHRVGRLLKNPVLFATMEINIKYDNIQHDTWYGLTEKHKARWLVPMEIKKNSNKIRIQLLPANDK